MERTTNISEPNLTTELQLLFIGSRCFGVRAEEVEALADWHAPNPLPGAPPSVLGVVCIRGRMLTVLDIGSLFGEQEKSAGWLVALRGDEQLALAVGRAGDVIQLESVQREPGNVNALISGTVSHGNLVIDVINCAALFPTAMRGRERRRRRF